MSHWGSQPRIVSPGGSSEVVPRSWEWYAGTQGGQAQSRPCSVYRRRRNGTETVSPRVACVWPDMTWSARDPDK